mmetsp:Transcript_6237/g.6785  ORF Transcript_6237/g.6785 Transcript_6237/m.6785 type:complete len:140 (+) Transcript_6237:59-478(+)
MFSKQIFLVAITTLVTISSIDGFAVSSIIRRSSGTTKLQVSTVSVEDGTNYVDDQQQQPIEKQQQQQKSQTTMSSDILFLPKLGQDSIKRKQIEKKLVIEMNVGRIAMLAAIIMFGIELVKGESLTEQLHHLNFILFNC